MNQENVIDIDIYEAAAKLTQVGAGITLLPRTWEMLDKLGLSDSMMSLLPKSNKDELYHIAFKLRKSDQLEGIELGDLFSKGKLQPPLSREL